MTFGLWWVFVAACGLSLAVASRGYSSVLCAGSSLWWPLLLWGTGFGRAGFSGCSTLAHWLQCVGSRAHGLQYLWRMNLVASQHVEPSQTRDQNCIPYAGRQILIHCPTREVQKQSFSRTYFLKPLGINLTKEVKDLYAENCKTLIKEIEDNSKK